MVRSHTLIMDFKYRYSPSPHLYTIGACTESLADACSLCSAGLIGGLLVEMVWNTESRVGGIRHEELILSLKERKA